MQRRTFVGASVAALTSAAAGLGADPKPAGADVYELRKYTLTPAKWPVLDAYLKSAYVPAVKRHGAGLVGVFTDRVDVGDTPLMYAAVLVVHSSGASVTAMPGKLAADEVYQKAAADYLAAKAADPVYVRIETSVSVAIPGMPKLAKPDTAKPRLLNLRVYESHNERAAAKKVEMFEKGELEIFKRVGLTPVFFASAVAGAAMPNLTYLLTFPDQAGQRDAWNAFRTDPAWVKLKAMPEYADKEIVSKITNTLWAPTAYSEI